MNELLVVKTVQVISAALVIALLFGWLPAWRAKAPEVKTALWRLYGICMVLAVLMFLLGNPRFLSSHSMRDGLLCGDSSPYARLDKLLGGEGWGMSYQAGVYVMAQVDGIRIIAVVYCIAAFRLWRRQSRQEQQPSQA
ncbi:hypothetical protein [Prosthecobacter sp.]|uniref:hypothetical protein n=1 Tax=Prosthecobacter sp. TaxID=1965333 RepID=UPI0037851FC3